MLIRPIRDAWLSVNHSAPSDPVVIPTGAAEDVGVGYSVIWGLEAVALVGMRPILLAPHSVNHIAPSGPAVISAGSPVEEVVILYSVIVPLVVIWPIRSPPNSVNHSELLPDGPGVMSSGIAPLVGIE